MQRNFTPQISNLGPPVPPRWLGDTWVLRGANAQQKKAKYVRFWIILVCWEHSENVWVQIRSLGPKKLSNFFHFFAFWGVIFTWSDCLVRFIVPGRVNTTLIHLPGVWYIIISHVGPLWGLFGTHGGPQGPIWPNTGSNWEKSSGGQIYSQIWSLLSPIGLTGLESWLPHTLAWYWDSSWPPGAPKGPILTQNAPFGAPVGPRRVPAPGQSVW